MGCEAAIAREHYLDSTTRESASFVWRRCHGDLHDDEVDNARRRQSGPGDPPDGRI